MHGTDDEDTKKDRQAWRKLPRKFAPKSRLGCKTCKIRRVKCDLTRPSCLKCQLGQRTCDGYENQSPGPGNNTCTNIAATTPIQEHAGQYRTCTQSLGPLMILPVSGPAQAEAMSFFEGISIKYLNEYQPCGEWRKTLMHFSQTVPSVRNAATALALIHRNYIEGYTTDGVNQQDWLTKKTALVHYNRAIQLLLTDGNGEDCIAKTAITLLVCYLFTCCDHLANNDSQAIKHLRGGIELARNTDEVKANRKDNCSSSSGFRTLINLVTKQIRRLDMQAVMYLLDWTPGDIQQDLVMQLPSLNEAFHSMEQAADDLQLLIARMMKLRGNEEQLFPTNNTHPIPTGSALKDAILQHLETWSHLFENLLQQDETRSYETDPEMGPLVSILRLQSMMAWTFLRSYGPGREMEYDKFLFQFQQGATLAEDVTAAHQRYSGSLKPTFTPEIGILPIIYIIGAKCRHPAVRRKILCILRRQHIREAAWDSVCVATVLERIIEIEESELEAKDLTHGMEKIPIWQRIEAMTWLRVVNGQPRTRLDLTYTFCAREGVNNESLRV